MVFTCINTSPKQCSRTCILINDSSLKSDATSISPPRARPSRHRTMRLRRPSTTKTHSPGREAKNDPPLAKASPATHVSDQAPLSPLAPRSRARSGREEVSAGLWARMNGHYLCLNDRDKCLRGLSCVELHTWPVLLLDV